ncbi:UNVERIFIED_CONTAM: hypothetical protein FKN15_011315, partial [Acipenser sinensis]
QIATSNPLVSERQDLSVLKREYAQEDLVYQQKIKDLHKKYSCIRKTRPDGNCFYRAFGFSHLEALLEDSKELHRFKAVAAQSKVDLVTQGFTEFTIEDFHNTFMDLIELVEKQGSVTDLLNGFNEQSTSDYLVVYLRLLTSGYLQREGGFFEHFIEGGRSVKEFCQQVRGSLYLYLYLYLSLFCYTTFHVLLKGFHLKHACSVLSVQSAGEGESRDEREGKSREGG